MMDVIEELLRRVQALQRKVVRLETLERGSGSGVTDHGALSGLGDDDHSQYYNQARGDARYAPLAKGVTNGDSHNHVGGDGGQVQHTDLGNLNSDNYTHLTAAQVTDLTDGGETTLHTHASTYLSSVCQGRLSLISGGPYPTSDVTGGTALYFSPVNGNQVTLYNPGTGGWDLFTIPSPSVALSLVGLAGSQLYDIFLYENAGTLTLLAGQRTAGNELAWQDGVLVHGATRSRRYLGTIYTDSGGGACTDTPLKRNVWNMYNRIFQHLTVTNTSAHYYNGAARLWNNSEANNRLEFVVGWEVDSVIYHQRCATAAGVAATATQTQIYLDGSYLAGSSNIVQITNIIASGVSQISKPSYGFHYVNIYETGASANSYFSTMVMSVGVIC